MTEIDPAASGATAPRRAFRRLDVPNLTAAQARRQGEVTRLALMALGKDEAIAYLNLACERLGGRPLDLATASVDGFLTVKNDLAGRSGKGGKPMASGAGRR